MFDINLYTFSKKPNSTAAPSTAALTVSCTAKLPFDILNPVVQLQLAGGAAANPSSYNYARIASFNRYYRISSWKNIGPLWEASLIVDVLASWKTQLGANSIYVYRAAYSYDLNVEDRAYPTTARQHRLNVTIPKVWTIGGANERGAADGSGVYVVGILTSNRGTVYGAFTPTQFEIFINALFSDDYYDAVLTSFGATEYPEAKVAVNPMQFITMCKFCPIGLITSGYWGIRYTEEIFGISVGPVALDFLTQPVSWYRITSTNVPGANSFSIYDIAITSDFLHPQADNRGNWLNYSPYTTYELFYPPFGLIQLDPVDVSAYAYLRIRLSLDVRTCTCTLEVQVYDTAANIRTIAKMQAPFGVDVQLSNIIQPGTSAIGIASTTFGSIAGAVKDVFTGNFGGAIQNVFNAVNAGAGEAVKGQIPHVSTFGGPGSTAALDGYPKLYVTHWYMANDDLNGKGRPLMAVRQISAIPGYIIGDPDEISIPCTETELNMIKNVVSEGFFYE